MGKRFVSIWFRHLKTDWFTIRQRSISSDSQTLSKVPFVLRASSHGRMMVMSANAIAERMGVQAGMVLADARAIVPDLIVQDDKPDLIHRLLTRLAEWCIRFTPFVAIDPPDGLFLDSTGCAHLWGGEFRYLEEIIKKLGLRGYDVRASMADTPGVAWAVARFGRGPLVVENGKNIEAILPLPPESLRLETETTDRLHKLGLRKVNQFINLPRPSLRRRFGPHFLMRLDMCIGRLEEVIVPVQPIEPYSERLPSMEPIVTASGISIALKQLLETLCHRLLLDQKGLRQAVFKCYRVDGKIEQAGIGTNQPTYRVSHLFRLFEEKLQYINPALGIELFTLEALKVEDHYPHQEKMWEESGGMEDVRLSELIDQLGGKVGSNAIHRYLPDEHYWPERSFKAASSLQETRSSSWRADKLRPLQLLKNPEKIEVTAPIPDYPPMLFRYKGKVHKVVLADGPERIEQEWWIHSGQHRDYYRVEDEEGKRYWIFRSGHYDDEKFEWYLHGWFA